MKSVRIGLLAATVGCALALQFPLAAAAGAKENILHAFGSGTDGSEPSASVIDVKGALYGTTQYGGASGGGAVFALDPGTGAETVLFSFCSDYPACTDGFLPEAGLIDVNGTLYGTTQFGGSHNAGTLFALDPGTGAETVLYSFCGTCTLGREPVAGLIDVKGRLYGTTAEGSIHGRGAVFALDPNTGAGKVLYAFCSQQNCPDGSTPLAGVIDAGHTLYGTTLVGGTWNAGTVFALENP